MGAARLGQVHVAKQDLVAPRASTRPPGPQTKLSPAKVRCSSWPTRLTRAVKYPFWNAATCISASYSPSGHSPTLPAWGTTTRSAPASARARMYSGKWRS